MKLQRLNKSNETWAGFEAAWEAECAEFGEDYASFAQASLGTLRNECDNANIDPSTGVFALVDDKKRFHAACFLNNTPLPGFTGKVLRVRHLLLSPYYDFSALSIEQYAEILGAFFVALYECSQGELKSQHIKIHYRSPYDRMFFAAFGMTMSTSPQFSTVESVGMWLHLTKR